MRSPEARILLIGVLADALWPNSLLSQPRLPSFPTAPISDRQRPLHTSPIPLPSHDTQPCYTTAPAPHERQSARRTSTPPLAAQCPSMPAQAAQEHTIPTPPRSSLRSHASRASSRPHRRQPRLGRFKLVDQLTQHSALRVQLPHGRQRLLPHRYPPRPQKFSEARTREEARAGRKHKRKSKPESALDLRLGVLHALERLLADVQRDLLRLLHASAFASRTRCRPLIDRLMSSRSSRARRASCRSSMFSEVTSSSVLSARVSDRTNELNTSSSRDRGADHGCGLSTAAIRCE
ncbi:hypothetical protein C8T65DRAFT_288162 [Cerioporus squamosus]|nr:hypothetical protein C8T65DRAFT_288162 [Cerioporus squamosus]